MQHRYDGTHFGALQLLRFAPRSAWIAISKRDTVIHCLQGELQ